jgi:hypothetical protein
MVSLREINACLMYRHITPAYMACKLCSALFASKGDGCSCLKENAKKVKKMMVTNWSYPDAWLLNKLRSPPVIPAWLPPPFSYKCGPAVF